MQIALNAERMGHLPGVGVGVGETPGDVPEEMMP